MTTTNAIHSPYAHAYAGSAAERYQREFVPAIAGPFAEDLVAGARLAAGQRVLDVACGTGVVARLAAERVGPGGAVTALDLNPGMLSVARALPSSGAEIRWYETAAESMPLPDGAFDLAFCQLGLQFMADKVAAIREMRRVLVPGGRVFASMPPPSAFFDVLDAALTRHVGSEAGGFVRMVFSLQDPASIDRLFREGGFDDVTVRTRARTLRLPAARDFLWQYVHCTPLSAMLLKVDVARLAALEAEVVARWQRWSHDGGIACEQEMHVAEART